MMVGYGLANCQEHTSVVHVNGLGLLTLCVSVYLIMEFISSVPNLGLGALGETHFGWV